MGDLYYNRYTNFSLNGQFVNVPYVKLPAKSTDKTITYKIGKSRLDKVSQTYYGSPFFGWLILQANGLYGGSELEIADNTILVIPFPLQPSLLDYKSAIDQHFYYYGK